MHDFINMGRMLPEALQAMQAAGHAPNEAFDT
jgi:hypothetical protein